MATKVSNLTQGTVINDNDLIYVVINGASRKMLKSDFDKSLVSGNEDGYVSGVIEWVSGLTFKSVQLYWRKNNVLFYSNDVQRTSATADVTDPRIDNFYGDNVGDWGIIEGTAAPSPVLPPVDEETQVHITFATIPAGATEPSDYNDTTAYNENIEWATSTDNNPARFDPDNTEQAFSGVKSIKLTNFSSAKITAPVARAGADLNLVKFWVYLDTLNFNYLFRLQFSIESGGVASLFISDGDYGFDKSLTQQWQQITVPSNVFFNGNWGTEKYTAITIANRKNGSTIYIDEVIVQDGEVGEVIPPVVIYANEVVTDTTPFTGNLSGSDTDVQKALETIDGLALGGAVEGTAVLSSGEVGGTKFLREDGDGTSSWQTVVAGSGTVTSVAVSGSDGIEIDSGSPITTSGTIALGVNKSTLLNNLGLSDVDTIGFAFSDETTDLAILASAISFQMPDFATTLSAVSVNVVTAPTGSIATFDINEGGVSILSTKITIDAGEFTSETAATPPVISDSSIAANAIITVDIDGVGSTITGAGGKVWIYFTRT